MVLLSFTIPDWSILIKPPLAACLGALLDRAALGPCLSVRLALPLLRLDDLLAFGSADAYHFDPKTQQFLSSLLAAVAIIGAGHRRNDSGVGDLLLEHWNKVRTVGRVAQRQHQCGDKATSAACQLRAVTHHRVPSSFNDKRGVGVAQADDLFCHRHFLLLHDPSFADVGSLFQSCQILSDEAQGFLAPQTPTRCQIGAALQLPANRLQIAQQTFAQSTRPPHELEIQLLALEIFNLTPCLCASVVNLPCPHFLPLSSPQCPPPGRCHAHSAVVS